MRVLKSRVYVTGEGEQLQQRLLGMGYEIATSVTTANIFILVADGHTIDELVELGMAIGARVPRIYVVGIIPDLSYYYHPAIQQRTSIEEVLNELAGQC